MKCVLVSCSLSDEHVITYKRKRTRILPISGCELNLGECLLCQNAHLCASLDGFVFIIHLPTPSCTLRLYVYVIERRVIKKSTRALTYSLMPDEAEPKKYFFLSQPVYKYLLSLICQKTYLLAANY